MKIYIAGPMTGRENFNREAFNKEAERLTRHGHTVLNPASLPDGLEQREYMDICFAMLRCADAILMLPSWQTSSGATAEYHYAYK
ncbi:nucleoside 2-deoxyribosyltransferase, partial [Klebsiella pneumoniae]